MPASSTAEPSTVLATIKDFLSSCRKPALLEEGEEPITLSDDNHAVECRGGRLRIEAWDRNRNITRRVLDVEAERPGRLLLLIERFGKRQGRLTLYDQARPGSAVTGLKGNRLVGREVLRRFLARQFPGWRLAALSADANLEHSLSPAYPRAFLTRGSTGWAAIAAPPESVNPDGVLAYGLIWLDYLRRRESGISVEGLALFLGEGNERTTCLRLRHLDPQSARYTVFACSEDGFEERIDPSDYGNLDTRIEVCRTPVTDRLPGNGLLQRILQMAAVENVRAPDGSISIRVRGFEFARFRGDTLEFGIHQKRVAGAQDFSEIEMLVSELARFRSPDAADRT
ncbi:MAG: hypothetical protein GY953_12105, partial [bacterium]|nr:hypothetical protein [bacterium]